MGKYGTSMTAGQRNEVKRRYLFKMAERAYSCHDGNNLVEL